MCTNVVDCDKSENADKKGKACIVAIVGIVAIIGKWKVKTYEYI